MDTKSHISAAFLLFYIMVLAILSNVGYCREASSSSISVANANHSNFVKANFAKRKAVCRDDPESCRRAHMHEPGKWACCAKKYCVDLDCNEYNCGKCGHPCGFGLHCCKGKCVDFFTDPNHCGSCFNQCHHEKCEFGICGYGQAAHARSTPTHTV